MKNIRDHSIVVVKVEMSFTIKSVEESVFQLSTLLPTYILPSSYKMISKQKTEHNTNTIYERNETLMIFLSFVLLSFLVY